MKTAVTSLTSLVLVGCATAPTQADRGTLGANLDTLLRTAVGQKRVPGVVAAVATGDGIAYEGPASMSKVGFGFALNSKPVEKGRGANTMSWVGVFNTFFWIDREKKVCAVLMTQMSPGPDDGPAKLLEDFDRAVYSWLR